MLYIYIYMQKFLAKKKNNFCIFFSAFRSFTENGGPAAAAMAKNFLNGDSGRVSTASVDSMGENFSGRDPDGADSQSDLAEIPAAAARHHQQQIQAPQAPPPPHSLIQPQSNATAMMNILGFPSTHLKLTSHRGNYSNYNIYKNYFISIFFQKISCHLII